MKQQFDAKDILVSIFGSEDRVDTLVEKWPQLDSYSNLLGQLWGGKALTQKEKSLLFIGVLMAKGNSEMLNSVLGELRRAQLVSEEELSEVVSTVMISRGPIALAMGHQAGIDTESHELTVPAKSDNQPVTKESIMDYFTQKMGQVPKWISLLAELTPNGLEAYYGLRNQILVDAVLPRKIKELVLVAVNAAGLYEEGMRIHAMGCLQAGGKKEDLYEALLVAFVGGGVVSWIEGVRVLSEMGLV